MEAFSPLVGGKEAVAPYNLCSYPSFSPSSFFHPKCKWCLLAPPLSWGHVRFSTGRDQSSTFQRREKVGGERESCSPAKRMASCSIICKRCYEEVEERVKFYIQLELISWYNTCFRAKVITDGKFLKEEAAGKWVTGLRKEDSRI